MQYEKKEEQGQKDEKKVLGEEDVERWSSLGGMREMGSTGDDRRLTSTREHTHGGKMC
jgi:hypothetical protein